jgi:hypothetical protein
MTTLLGFVRLWSTRMFGWCLNEVKHHGLCFTARFPRSSHKVLSIFSRCKNLPTPLCFVLFCDMSQSMSLFKGNFLFSYLASSVALLLEGASGMASVPFLGGGLFTFLLVSQRKVYVCISSSYVLDRTFVS